MRRSVMKRILSAFIEASMFITCMVWAYRQMTERFESVQRLYVILLINACAIFVAKARGFCYRQDFP